MCNNYYQNKTPKAERRTEKHWHTILLNISIRLRGPCRLTDKLSVLSEPRHVTPFGSHYLVAETSSVSSVFITRGYLRSNAQNRHPFIYLPQMWHSGLNRAWAGLGLQNVARLQLWSAAQMDSAHAQPPTLPQSL